MKKLLILFTCLATLCNCSNEKETAPYSCSGDQELIDGVGYTVNTVSITDDCNDNTIDSKTYCVCKKRTTIFRALLFKVLLVNLVKLSSLLILTV